MDNANYAPPMLSAVTEGNLLCRAPFTLIDVGCSGGLDPAWRLFGSQLKAYGFDPQQGECQRLQAAERNPDVRYFAHFIGLSKDHPFLVKKRAEEPPGCPYSLEGLHRSSAWLAASLGKGKPQSNPIHEELTQSTVSIDEFVQENGISDIDFVKIDTDGSDLEATISCARAMRDCDILGFMIESNLQGTAEETHNSFFNIDRYMKQQGYMLAALSINKYSRAALPAPFLFPICAQTVSGPPIWGDAVYLRDAAMRGDGYGWIARAPSVKLLKLACLYELFNLPDCAAELLLNHGSKIADIIDPRLLLNLLTPPVDGKRVPYDAYMDFFHENTQAFFPKQNT